MTAPTPDPTGLPPFDEYAARQDAGAIEVHADEQAASNDRSLWPYVTAAKPRLRDVEARAAAATEGPWRFWNDGVVGYPTRLGLGLGVNPSPNSDHGDQRRIDATFIAASRTDVPALTAAIRAVLAIEPPFVDEYTDADEGWNDALTIYRTAIRAALSRHIDLDES
jgi:hypothetical protein